MDFETIAIKDVYKVLNDKIKLHLLELKSNPYSTSSVISIALLRETKRDISLKYRKKIKHIIIEPKINMEIK